MRRAAFVLVSLAISASLALPASALAKRHEHPTHRSCRAGYVRRVVHRPKRHRGRIVRRHGHTVYVRRVECVRARKRKTTKPQPSPQGNGTTTTPAPTQTTPVALHVALDPSFTQNPANPLQVTYSVSASATTSLVGVTQTTNLPSGVLETFSDGQLASTIAVGGATTGGPVQVTYSTYGQHTINVVYDSGTNSATTGNQAETIEPLPTTTTDAWGSSSPTVNPTASIEIVGSQATVAIDDANYEGASSLGISDGNGDSCNATISHTTASCTMSVGSVPTSLNIAYPGGTTTTATVPVANSGQQQQTTVWPSETVTISNPTYPDCSNAIAQPVMWSSPMSGCETISATVGKPVTIGTVLTPQAIERWGGNPSQTHGFVNYYVDGSEDMSCYGVQQTNLEPIGSCTTTFTTPGLHTISAMFVPQTDAYQEGNLAPIYVEVSN